MHDQPITRRTLLGRGALTGAALALSRPLTARGAIRTTAPTPADGGWYAPVDTIPHERTWMAWPARRDVWGRLLGPVREDIARVAATIARYEPVSLIARPSQAAEAAAACGAGVEIVEIPNDDLWMRDMGPIFLVNGEGGLAGVDLNFNGWGGHQVHNHDRLVARLILERLGLQRFDAPFVSEGGALETNGSGTIMATESSIINRNRNPGRTKGELTGDICAFLGAEEMIWVPGLNHHDITDDHVDSLARFVAPSTIVVDQPSDPLATDVWAVSEREALALLEHDRNAQGEPLTCLISRESALIPPKESERTFVNVYVNWYVCNGAVLIPSFDDPAADQAAYELVSRLFPGRTVEQLRIDAIAAGGGGIHCATQQQPVAL